MTKPWPDRPNVRAMPDDVIAREFQVYREHGVTLNQMRVVVQESVKRHFAEHERADELTKWNAIVDEIWGLS